MNRPLTQPCAGFHTVALLPPGRGGGLRGSAGMVVGGSGGTRWRLGSERDWGDERRVGSEGEGESATRVVGDTNIHPPSGEWLTEITHKINVNRVKSSGGAGRGGSLQPNRTLGHGSLETFVKRVPIILNPSVTHKSHNLRRNSTRKTSYLRTQN